MFFGQTHASPLLRQATRKAHRTRSSSRAPSCVGLSPGSTLAPLAGRLANTHRAGASTSSAQAKGSSTPSTPDAHPGR